MNASNFTGLARALVQTNLLQQADADAIIQQASGAGLTFIQQLVISKKLSAAQIAEFAAQMFGFPLMDLNVLDPGSVPHQLLDHKLMVGRRILPLYKRGNKLFVAMSDPTNIAALEEAKFQTSLAIDPIVVEDNKLGSYIEKTLESSGANLKNMTSDDIALDDIEAEPSVESSNAGTDISSDVDDAPIVRYVQKVDRKSVV